MTVTGDVGRHQFRAHRNTSPKAMASAESDGRFGMIHDTPSADRLWKAQWKVN
jgi:hypothetical protein